TQSSQVTPSWPSIINARRTAGEAYVSSADARPVDPRGAATGPGARLRDQQRARAARPARGPELDPQRPATARARRRRRREVARRPAPTCLPAHPRRRRGALPQAARAPQRFTPRGIHNQISHAKNQLVGPDEYAQRVQSFYDQTVADAYQLYQRRLFASNAVDFDDLLMLTVDVLERFPEALEKWQSAFRYILVDEYQDTNHAQYRLLQLLAKPDMNVCAVGDPDQSIYAFRGADINNILDFERDFAGTRTIALEQNYRSTNN